MCKELFPEYVEIDFNKSWLEDPVPKNGLIGSEE